MHYLYKFFIYGLDLWNIILNSFSNPGESVLVWKVIELAFRKNGGPASGKLA